MPDYNLGRAHGEVVITADTQGATRAMGDYQKATDQATASAKQQSRVEQELTERRRAATEAARRRKDAEAEYKRVMADSTSTAEEQIEAEQRRNKTRSEHLQITRRVADAERAYRAEVVGNTEAVERFLRTLNRSNNAVNVHSGKMREMRMEAEKLSRAMNSLSGVVTHTFSTLGRGLAVVGGAAAAGGLLGMLGAGGTQGLVVGLAGAASVIAQFSGSLLLIPAAGAAAAGAIGTLTLAFKGVGDALKNMDDIEKFKESLRKLGPATQQFVLQIFQFRDVFRGFKQTIQDGLFAPLIKEVEPLVRALLPSLMNGLKTVANAFGELGAGFAQWLRTPETVASITMFLDTMGRSLKAMLPGMESFSNAFRTLINVGGTFMPQLAESFNQVAQQFNNWIEGLAKSGKLKEWIQGGIDAFGQLARSVRDIGIAIANIFNAGGAEGGALGWIEKLAAKFREWTESVEGNRAITGFFAKVREATDALMPILKVAGEAVASLVGSLTDTGIASSDGMLSFFKSLRDAIKTLGEGLVESGPALGDILNTVGDAIKQIMEAVGPQLPTIFKTFGEVLASLAPILVQVAGAAADFLASLTPTQIQWILGIAAAIGAMVTILGPLAGIITTVTGVAAALGVSLGTLVGGFALVVGIIAGVIAAGVAIYKNWDEIKDKAHELWENLKEAWTGITEAITNAFGTVKEVILGVVDNALDWGKKLLENFANGIIDSIPGLRTVIDKVADLIPDSWLTHSPAKRGPLSKVSPNEMGEKLVENFADGIQEGQPHIQEAAFGVAGAAQVGLSGSGSGEVAGKGGSGLEQYTSAMTGELRLWSTFLQHAFNVAKSIADMAVNSVKTVANIMKAIENANGTPHLPEQKSVDGVPSVKPPGPNTPVPDLPAQVQGEAPGAVVAIANPSNAGAAEPTTPVIRNKDGSTQSMTDPSLSNPVAPATNVRTIIPRSPVNAGGASNYIGDDALLANVPAGRYINPNEDQSQADLTKGLADCTSSIEDLVAIMDGQPTGGRSMYTGNAESWLSEKGFLVNTTGANIPGAFNIGYWDDRASGQGHMQATLPGGTNFNWGSNTAAAARGMNGGGAFDPFLNQGASQYGATVYHYYRPVNGPGEPRKPYSEGITEAQKMNEDYGLEAGLEAGTLEGLGLGPYSDLKQFERMKLGAGITEAEKLNIIDNPVSGSRGLPSASGGLSAGTSQADQMLKVLNVVTDVIGDVSNVIGDGFQVFDDVLTNVDAGSRLTARAVRGIESTEDIYASVDDIQTFIKTAADIAKMTSTITGIASKYIGMAAAGDTSGGTAGAAAALGAVSSISALIQTGLETTNAVIDLGQEVYRISTKYGAMFAGQILGGPATGPLGGNVRMLLNTNNGQIMTYSEDNSQLKNFKQMPNWMANAYGGTRGPQIQQTQVNLFTGPGSDPKQLISDTMWLVNVGAPQTVSVAGRE